MAFLTGLHERRAMIFPQRLKNAPVRRAAAHFAGCNEHGTLELNLHRRAEMNFPTPLTEQEKMGKESAKRAKAWWTFLAITLLWGGLAWGGFPFPFIDDPFYIGAGLNLAAGGGLANPLIEGSGTFLRYLPLHSFVIAGWLKLFGTSAGAMVALYLLFGWVSTWCTIRGFQILRKDLLGWMAGLSIVIYCTCVGMRPDACSLCFAAVSFRLGISRKQRTLYLAPFFAALAVAALPASMAMMFPWIAFLMITHKGMWKAVFAAGGVVALMLCMLIHWQIQPFLAEFLIENQGARADQISWIRTEWKEPMGWIKFIYPFASVSLLIAWAALRRGLSWIDALASGSVILALYAIVNSVSGHRVMGLITVIVVGLYLEYLAPGPRWRRLLVAVNGLLIIGSGLRPMLQGVTTERPSNGAQLLSQVQTAHPARLIIDEWSLRYVFGFHLEPGMIAIGQSARPFGRGVRISVKYPDECWVMAAETVAHFHLDPHGLPEPRFFSFRGKKFENWVVNAGEIGVSPPGQ